jgi:hypothetical protein
MTSLAKSYPVNEKMLQMTKKLKSQIYPVNDIFPSNDKVKCVRMSEVIAPNDKISKLKFHDMYRYN